MGKKKEKEKYPVDDMYPMIDMYPVIDMHLIQWMICAQWIIYDWYVYRDKNVSYPKDMCNELYMFNERQMSNEQYTNRVKAVSKDQWICYPMSIQWICPMTENILWGMSIQCMRYACMKDKNSIMNYKHFPCECW